MPDKKVKISVAIITKNEEKNIGRCLESVKTVADEVVVVDSFSTDGTKQICLQQGVRFIEHKFEGHIQQKNYAVSQCNHDYVLSLDADEALSEKAVEAILSIRENPSYDAYSFNRLTRYCGKWIRHSGWYPDRKLRLWNKNKGSWQGMNPHDKFVMDKNASVRKLKADILHYSINSVEEHMATVRHFSAIAARAKFEEGKRATWSDIHLRPRWKFFRNYFIRAGFLDGYEGYLVCRISAFATFLRYARLRELQQNTK